MSEVPPITPPEHRPNPTHYPVILASIRNITREINSLPDGELKESAQERLNEQLIKRQEKINEAENMGYLSTVHQLIDVRLSQITSQRSDPNIGLYEKAFNDSVAHLKGLRPDMNDLMLDYLQTEYNRREEELIRNLRTPNNTRDTQEEEPGLEGSEAEIEDINQKMTQIEKRFESYQSLNSQRNQELFELQEQVGRSQYSEVRDYFSGRSTMFDTFLAYGSAQGDMDAFSKVAAGSGTMYLPAVMFARKEVSAAYQILEGRFVGETKESIAFARDSDTRNQIRGDMAAEVAISMQKYTDAEYSVVKTARAKDKSTLSEEEKLALKKYDSVSSKYMWTVLVADAFSRGWLRMAKFNGLVFFNGQPNGDKRPPTSEEMELIKSLRFDQLSDHWDLIQEVVDFGNSLEGDGGYAVRRMVHDVYFLEKNKVGDPHLRKYVGYGSIDFLSDFLKGRIMDSKQTAFNFRDPTKEGFKVGNTVTVTIDNQQHEIGTYYISDSEEFGRQEVFIRTNGVIELIQFNPRSVKWRIRGDDAFTGSYLNKRILKAEALRNEIVGPEGFLKAPAITRLPGLKKGLDYADSVFADLEKGFDIEQKRREGVFYKEDLIGQMAKGMLSYFKTKEYAEKFNTYKWNLAEVKSVTEGARNSRLITPEKSQELLNELMTIKGISIPGPIRELIEVYYYAAPWAILLALLGYIFEKTTPLQIK